MLHLFLDTADIDEIRDAYSLIRLDGVTTNPSILAGAKNKYGSPVLELKVIYKFLEEHGGQLHIQPVASLYDEILKDAYYILEEVGENVWIKIPVTEDGLAAISRLSAEGIKVTAASVFTFTQGMLAYKAGADTVSVYCNRAEEKGIEYAHVIESLKNAFPDRVLLAASFRTTDQIERASFAGADSLTIKPKLLFQDLKTDLMRDTVANFQFSWESAFKSRNLRRE